ncbi:MAG: hypothetical protein ACO1RX_12695 [Candidatus Sericytochromatia bacterium]
MKPCPICSQEISEELMLCPSCLKEARDEDNIKILTSPLFSDEPKKSQNFINSLLKNNVQAKQKSAYLTSFRLSGELSPSVVGLSLCILIGLSYALVQWHSHLQKYNRTSESLQQTTSENELSFETIFTNQDGVFIRLNPGVKAPILITAAQNMPLKVIPKESIIQDGHEWLHIELPYGEKGWIAQKYASPQKTELPPWIQRFGGAVIRDNISIYQYPSVRSHVVTTANIGNKYVFTGRRIQSGKTIWLHLETDSAEGWVDRTYVSTYQEELGDYALDRPVTEFERSVPEEASVDMDAKTQNMGNESISGDSTILEWNRASEEERGKYAALFTYAWFKSQGATMTKDEIILKAGFLMLCVNKAGGTNMRAKDVAFQCAQTLGF